MGNEPSSGQPTTIGSGNPTDLSGETLSVRAVQRAVDQLEMHRKYMERDLDQARGDMRDVRDRLRAIEVKVDSLPSKVWIGSAVLGGMAVLSGLFTLATRLLGH